MLLFYSIVLRKQKVNECYDHEAQYLTLFINNDTTDCIYATKGSKKRIGQNKKKQIAKGWEHLKNNI